MVVGLALAAIQMGMALPTGFLFGVGYGTGVRIGYEQVYPLLFPKGARPTTTELAATMKGMNTVYDAIGGKDASRMGIAVGIINAGDILKNPDFQVLEKLELSSSGPTSSNSNRLVSGRGSLDLSDSSSSIEEEIEVFNKQTGSEKWARYRGYTITQLNNIISSTTNADSRRIAVLVLNEKLQDQGNGPSTEVSGTPSGIVGGDLAPSLGKNLAQAEAFTKWQKTLINLKQSFNNIRNKRDFYPARSQPWNAQNKLLFPIQSTIRSMSNDYRSPNNGIRSAALDLRREIASGWWKR